jgi:hypothetical protein
MDWLEKRKEQANNILNKLINSKKFTFDKSIRSNLPEDAGIYAISFNAAQPSEYLIAGRTKGTEGLRQRIYQNHLMGNQIGNLRSKLVNGGLCPDMEHTKDWIRQNCVVQFVTIPDENLINWFEHYILSILRPKYNN